MKRSLLIFFAFTALVYSACKKNNDGPGELYGSWKLTETLADPGDGSGKYVKVKERRILTFERSGNITGDVLTPFTKYKVLDSARLELSADKIQTVIYYYKVTAKTLTINPQCIEGCGLRFIRED